MRRILASVALLFMASAAFAADSADSGPAIKAVNAWMALVDAGNYTESWKQAAPLFQQQVTELDWEKAVGAVRGPLGKVVKRSAPSAQYTTELPGAPTGQYWLIQDTADFEHQPGLTERVTLIQTSSGWQVIGYRIH